MSPAIELHYGRMKIGETEGIDVFMRDECVILQHHIRQGMEDYLAQVLEQKSKTDPSQSKMP